MNTPRDSQQASILPISLTAKDVSKMLRTRPADAHKGTMGHALLVAGSKGMAGAAILCSQGCLRSGVGKLTLHTPEANNVIMQCSTPEAVLRLDADEEKVTESIPSDSYQAVGIGPGLGTSEATSKALLNYLKNCKAPLVLDADALNIISQHPQHEKEIPSLAILTPHVGEFQRLTEPCPDAGKRALLAQQYAISHQVILILKGHPSVIYLPEGKAFSCPYGNSGMATPGSGDVLTGLITGLLAQGYRPDEAAILGVWLHALAGDEAAKELGEESMLASDIVAHIHKAYKELKNNKI